LLFDIVLKTPVGEHRGSCYEQLNTFFLVAQNNFFYVFQNYNTDEAALLDCYEIADCSDVIVPRFLLYQVAGDVYSFWEYMARGKRPTTLLNNKLSKVFQTMYETHAIKKCI
jgi:hypothetical protein